MAAGFPLTSGSGSPLTPCPTHTDAARSRPSHAQRSSEVGCNRTATRTASLLFGLPVGTNRVGSFFFPGRTGNSEQTHTSSVRVQQPSSRHRPSPALRPNSAPIQPGSRPSPVNSPFRPSPPTSAQSSPSAQSNPIRPISQQTNSS
ncbi:hypothetical protein CRG98_041864 [Punica granatum]|uniref:Uncharacterized protein n=1 Tax=Punica granatum TaxID=22663 RepID=A0A2I0I1B5_PUNGR|nr:hypothetical protein CRG98_041864 [Punica granatum]